MKDFIRVLTTLMYAARVALLFIGKSQTAFLLTVELLISVSFPEQSSGSLEFYLKTESIVTELVKKSTKSLRNSCVPILRNV